MIMDTSIHHSTVKLEDMTNQVQVPSDNVSHTNALSMAHVSDVMSDMSDDPSSPESTTFVDSDLLTANVVPDDVTDDVTAQLAAAGPIGMAAAAAIITGKKRKKHYSFETNPSIRKRQATRLLRKLKQLMTEYTTRVGQQACIVVCCPGKLGSSFKCFGAAPLENIVKNRKHLIMEDLENALAQQAPTIQHPNPDLHELPPLIIDGIPTPVDKMTQAQLRAFIPIMLKYSTGRGKPGWGRDNTKPSWWPAEVPWANVRSDVRTDEEKSKVSWTNALRKVVRNCYQFHGREELLDAFANCSNNMEQHHQQPSQVFTSQYPHLVHTINNADGTVSIIQVDATGAVTTLSESASHSEATQAVATLAEVAAASQGEVIYGNHTIDHTSLSQDHNNVSGISDGQLLLGGESGATALVGVQDSAGIVSIPVQAAAAMMQIQGTNLIPVSIANAGGVQFIATSSLSNFQLATHPPTQQQQQTQPPTADLTADESNNLAMDVSMQSVSEAASSSSNTTNTAPIPTHSVEVVSLTGASLSGAIQLQQHNQQQQQQQQLQDAKKQQTHELSKDEGGNNKMKETGPT